MSWQKPVKAGFHTWVIRTHNRARCLSMYGHQCSQAIPAFTIKACLASNQVAHVELLRGYARPVPQYAVTVTYGNHPHKKQKRFSVLRKKRAKPKKKSNDHFRKVFISNSISDALCNSHTSRYKRPRSKHNDVCLCKLAKQITFTRAQKHLMETILKEKAHRQTHRVLSLKVATSHLL